LHQHRQEGEGDLRADVGVQLVDGSDFPQQGVHAAGVKRLDAEVLGPQANCQAGVWVGYVSTTGDTGLARRL
jgi:hypothetical protein